MEWVPGNLFGVPGPLDGQQQYDLAVSYFLRGRYESASNAFEELVRAAPSDGRAWTYLGMTYAHLGRPAEAEEAISKGIGLGSKDSDAWFHLGIARGMRAEWSRAASAYRHAVALGPQDLVAWHRLGVALAESGDEPGSEAAFERALVLSRETGEDGPEEELEEGLVDTHLKEPGERDSFREAKSWIDLALSLLSLGEEEEAIAAYERAYTLDPERAQRSLFRPMLHLVASASAEAERGDGPAPADLDEEPRPRPSIRDPGRRGRVALG